ncbi:tektin-1 [Conger conger]|uniref:tektin-1 n=1 Tax=Conger conger TaxID=82655 RepID=UPI002A59DE8C|nr:tektin-1 [Conger conger]XP_061074096.1 tektin-1 [Conger conger]XP_061074098.1 tektin-1 [Conger conger]
MYKVKQEPPKFLPPEWWLTNRAHCVSAEAECSRSERLIAASRVVVEESNKAAQRMQQDANKKLEQRLENIRFWRQELNKKLEDMTEEIEVLITFRTRVEKALESCSQPLQVILQCLSERENHVGIDRVHDEVERELIKEREVTEGVISLLQRTLEQTNEQMRLNRSAKYWLEKDLQQKFQAEQIDDRCSVLTNASPGLSQTEKLPCSALSTSVTPEGWETSSDINISKAEKERNASASLRTLIHRVLGQTAEDMRGQHRAAASALQLRVQETKDAKEQIEDRLHKIQAEIANQERSLESLAVSLQAKQGPLKVAQTRLALRSQRPNPELCLDSAQIQLSAEVQDLSAHMERLNASLSQSEMELRALTQNQLSLEEQIQGKSNSLYIDEVICSSLHQSIAIHSF